VAPPPSVSCFGNCTEKSVKNTDPLLADFEAVRTRRWRLLGGALVMPNSNAQPTI